MQKVIGLGKSAAEPYVAQIEWVKDTKKVTCDNCKQSIKYRDSKTYYEFDVDGKTLDVCSLCGVNWYVTQSLLKKQEKQHQLVHLRLGHGNGSLRTHLAPGVIITIKRGQEPEIVWNTRTPDLDVVLSQDTSVEREAFCQNSESGQIYRLDYEALSVGASKSGKTIYKD